MVNSQKQSNYNSNTIMKFKNKYHMRIELLNENFYHMNQSNKVAIH